MNESRQVSTKEMIKWLEDVVSSYEDDDVISMSYSTVAAIVGKLKHYDTLKKEAILLKEAITPFFTITTPDP